MPADGGEQADRQGGGALVRVVKADVAAEGLVGQNGNDHQGVDVLAVEQAELLRGPLPLCVPVVRDDGLPPAQPGGPVGHVRHAQVLHLVHGGPHPGGAPLVGHVQGQPLLVRPAEQIGPVRRGIAAHRRQQGRQDTVQLPLVRGLVQGGDILQHLIHGGQGGADILVFLSQHHILLACKKRVVYVYI